MASATLPSPKLAKHVRPPADEKNFRKVEPQMTSISRTLRIALLASFLFTLLASPSFETTATGKNHSTKRPDARRTLPSKAGSKDQALRKRVSQPEKLD